MKKIITFFVLLILLGSYSLQSIFAAPKTKLLQDYFQSKNNEKQDFEFENIGDIDAMDALNLFRSNSKTNIYENVLVNVSEKRKSLEKENLEVLKKIDDLSFQLKSLDKSIKDLGNETKKINSQIVKKTIEIRNKQKKIEEINKKIKNTTEILRKYIVYIYKKGNLFLNKGKLDSFKAVLLSGNNLDKVLDDIYFKELMAEAGKNLINKHRKLRVKIYIEKKNLENDTFTLKNLRKKFAIKKKIIENKKKFKQKLLGITKGKNTLYKKYIEEKRAVEKKLQFKVFAEKIKFYSASKNLLGRYGCKFVDVSRNTPETRLLSPKCFQLNKIIALEAKLQEQKLKYPSKYPNIFSWPVPPYNGISAYFKDKEYKKEFKVEHNAIDIRAVQGTNIKAPLDGYVIDIKKPIDNSYAYVALKHRDGFITVYGHVSEVLVNKYDYVKAGTIFAKTGGIFGTLGAGFMTTGPHLHFEVLKDKKYVDPLQYLNISYLNIKDLPDYIKSKYPADYFERTGKQYSKKVDFKGKLFTLEGNTEIERQKSLLRKYARSDFNNWDLWVTEALRFHIDPTFMMCIGLAETGLGRHLKTSYNVGNVGNVDSGGTWTMTTPRQGIWWIGHTLNNKYLGKYNAIYKLSGYGLKPGEKRSIYASSQLNWHRNVIKCMSAIKGFAVPDDYNFRTY